ncbi:MAG: class I adenylate-forming enzyme family protein [Bacillota bacterium]
MRNVAEWLEFGEKRWGQKIALNTQDLSLSYAELNQRAKAFAKSCIQLGLKPGKRVVIWTSNRWETVIAIFGTFLAGGVAVCLHPRTPLSKIKVIIQETSPLIVVTEKYMPHLCEGSIRANVFLQEQFEINQSQNRLIVPFHFNEWLDSKTDLNYFTSTNAFILYTSGSTGHPKGIVSTHDNIFFSTAAINDFLQNTPEDKILSFLPLSFDYGLYQLFITFMTGGTLYLREADYFTIEFSQLLVSEKITALPGMRSIFKALLQMKKDSFPGLRYITNTGESLSPDMIDHLQKKFSDSSIFLMYGLTECKRVSILPADKLNNKLNSVGLPLKGTNVEIRDESGKLCRVGETGEIWVNGPHICQGYWNNEEATNKVFIDIGKERWLKTGDLAYQDAEGFLYYVGRKDAQFKSKGYRIDPNEIEELIRNKFTFVKDVCVVGIHDKRYGSIPVMLVVPAKHVEKSEIQMEQLIKELCKQALEPWKWPKTIIFRSELPITINGKTDLQYIRKSF